jgi:hypothetical protein
LRNARTTFRFSSTIPVKCEVLYTAEGRSLDTAKFAAVDFVAIARFGPNHGLKPETVAAMLVWQNNSYKPTPPHDG